MSTVVKGAMALVVAAALAACGESPTAVENGTDAQDLDVAAYSVFPDAFGTVADAPGPFGPGGQMRFGWDREDAPEWRPGHGFGMGPGPGGAGPAAGAGPNIPLLGVLLRQAYDTYAETHTEEEVIAYFSHLRELHQEAVEARRTGDREAFLEKAQLAHAEAARIVIDVLGDDVADDVLALAQSAVEDLQALIDSGTLTDRQLLRLQNVLDRAEALLEEAQAAQDADDPVAVLTYASRALQVTTVGGGQRGHLTGQGGPHGPPND